MEWQYLEQRITFDQISLLIKEYYVYLMKEVKVKEPFPPNLFYYVLDSNEENEKSKTSSIG